MATQLTELLVDIFGLDVWDDSPEVTAERVIRYWKEYEPHDISELDRVIKAFPAGDEAAQLVMVKDIEFSSMCAHHLLPFMGKVYVGYIPHELMIGLSKIPRIVDHFATRPQTQERLTNQIASYLKHAVSAKGVAVVIESQHTCMACRGVRKHNGSMVTSEMRGVFLTAEAARLEFLSLIGGR